MTRTGRAGQLWVRRVGGLRGYFAHPYSTYTCPYLQLKIYYENIGKNIVSITFLVQSHHFSSIKEAYRKGPNKRQNTTGIPTRIIVEKL